MIGIINSEVLKFIQVEIDLICGVTIYLLIIAILNNGGF